MIKKKYRLRPKTETSKPTGKKFKLTTKKKVNRKVYPKGIKKGYYS